MRQLPRSVKWCVWVAFVLAMAGCSSPEIVAKGTFTGAVDFDDIGLPAVETVPNLADPRGLVLPIQAYRFTVDQQVIVDRAHARLVEECMRRAGFRSAPEAARVPPTIDAMSRRYGVTDSVVATQLGYHFAPDQVVNRFETSPRLSPAELAALTGRADGRQPPPGRAGNTGCVGSASSKLGIDGIADSLTDQVEFRAFSQSKSDPRTAEVFTQWSHCMAEQGHPYATPLDAAASFDPSSTTILPAEIQTAVADVTCKTTANVVGVWYAVECAYENAAIQLASHEFAAIKEHNTVIFNEAVKVLA